MRFGGLGNVKEPSIQGSLKDAFCPFETWLFPPKLQGNHHLQGNVLVCNIEIPAIDLIYPSDKPGVEPNPRVD